MVRVCSKDINSESAISRDIFCSNSNWRCAFGLDVELTALLWALVVADQNLLVGSAEQPRPVDGAVVAELAVLCDVDVPGADLSEGLELQ